MNGADSSASCREKLQSHRVWIQDMQRTEQRSPEKCVSAQNLRKGSYLEKGSLQK